MRIALINLTGGGLSGGYRKYLLNMLDRMADDDAVSGILCALPRGITLESRSPKITFAECKAFSVFPQKDNVLLSALDKFGPDVIFVPVEKYFRYKNVPRVSMLLNMAPMADNYDRGTLLEKIKMELRFRQAGKAITTADGIIAPSGFVKDYIRKTWSVPENKITTIYFGADVFEPATDQPNQLKSLQPGGFFFSIGSAEKYRGYEDIIAALAQTGQKIKCAICTNARPAMRGYLNELKKAAQELNLENRLLWLQNATDREVQWLYQNARAFVMTSRVEAGPNTALECLTNGLPAVSANFPPHPEFFKNSSLYYNNPRELAGILDWLASDAATSEIEQLKNNVKIRAADFSWGKTAAETIAFFQQTLKH